MKRRQYRQTSRARKAEETRLRIVEATIALHREQGAAATSISAIAERAGVQRLTVYRHFPTQQDVLNACTGLWGERNPPPDPAEWSNLSDPVQRTRWARTLIYAYYGKSADMLRSAYRDLYRMPELKAPMGRIQGYFDAVRDDLLKAWAPPQSLRRRLKAALGHALHFPTWDSLRARGLKGDEPVDVMLQWVRCLAHGEHP
jgi:AcrR family transcriptional regulator